MTTSYVGDVLFREDAIAFDQVVQSVIEEAKLRRVARFARGDASERCDCFLCERYGSSPEAFYDAVNAHDGLLEAFLVAVKLSGPAAGLEVLQGRGVL